MGQRHGGGAAADADGIAHSALGAAGNGGGACCLQRRGNAVNDQLFIGTVGQSGHGKSQLGDALGRFNGADTCSAEQGNGSAGGLVEGRVAGSGAQGRCVVDRGDGDVQGAGGGHHAVFQAVFNPEGKAVAAVVGCRAGQGVGLFVFDQAVADICLAELGDNSCAGSGGKGLAAVDDIVAVAVTEQHPLGGGGGNDKVEAGRIVIHVGCGKISRDNSNHPPFQYGGCQITSGNHWCVVDRYDADGGFCRYAGHGQVFNGDIHYP